MNLLLLFFALPIATIILAVVLEKILRCPFLVSATFFAIYLIIAFSLFDAMFLVFVIAYTILAFLSALIAECFYRRCNNERKCSLKCCLCTQNNNNNNTITLSNQDIARIANQLANMQNVKPNTIEDHILELFIKGYLSKYKDYLNSQHDTSFLRFYIGNRGERLRNYKEKFPELSYFEIKLLIVGFERGDLNVTT